MQRKFNAWPALPAVLVFAISAGSCRKDEAAQLQPQATTADAEAVVVIGGDDHWHNRAVIAMAEGRCEDALTLLQAPETSPRAEIWYEDLIGANVACGAKGIAGNYKAEAMRLASEATAKYPDSSVLAAVRGGVYDSANATTLATEWYGRARDAAQANLRNDPDGPNAHRDRAILQHVDALLAQRSAGSKKSH
jgi:hypothetical protein